MVDFFQKSESADDHLAKDAAPGDMDLIESKLDGKLVVVCQVDGEHVCGYCLRPFDGDKSSKRRAEEWTPVGLSSRGENYGTRMLMHPVCIPYASHDLIQKRERGHKLRRFMTRFGLGGGS